MQIIKKLDTLETHDRLEKLVESESINIFKGAEDCLKSNEMSLVFQDFSPYIYIFAHPRMIDDGSGYRLLWQARLTRPIPQTNSYLFRTRSKSDEIVLCWFLPPRETWSQYDKGNVCDSEEVRWSIDMFVNHRDKLQENHPEDLFDGEIKYIYLQVDKHFIDKHFKENKFGKKLILPNWFV